MGQYHHRETRDGFEFDVEVRNQVRREQNNRCAWPGCNHKIEEIDHILAIGIAHKYYPHIPIDMIASRENAQGFCKIHHKKKHREGIDNGEVARMLVEMSKRVRV